MKDLLISRLGIGLYTTLSFQSRRKFKKAFDELVEECPEKAFYLVRDLSLASSVKRILDDILEGIGPKGSSNYGVIAAEGINDVISFSIF